MTRPLQKLATANSDPTQTNLQIVLLACRLERNACDARRQDEPELPKGYRHVRSAIGALLIVGRDHGF